MKSFKYMLMAAAASLTVTGCIDETFPEGGTATQEQVGASASALESSLRGIPTQMSQGYFVYGGQVHETDMAYAGLIIAQTEMLATCMLVKVQIPVMTGIQTTTTSLVLTTTTAISLTSPGSHCTSWLRDVTTLSVQWIWKLLLTT